MSIVEKVKEYNLPKGETVEDWVSKNWRKTGMEYYLKDQNDGTMYHFFPAFDFWTMKDLGFSDEDIDAIYLILAPVGEDSPEDGDTSTWYTYKLNGEIVSR